MRVTGSEPTLAQAWLTLGALELELHRPAEATAALKRYVETVESGDATTLTTAPAARRRWRLARARRG